MAAVTRVDERLRCGELDVAELADRFGTPLYLYDGQLIERTYERLVRAFDGVDLLVAYSVKANGNLAILNRLAGLGAGADIVSGGELHRARRAGIPGDRIVFAGVGKTVDELRAGIEEGIYGFNVESARELELLDEIASDLGRVAPFALRVNLDILSPTPHEYTRTGHAMSKFGVPAADALELYRWAHSRPGLSVRGIDVHIGSQIVDPEPYLRALDGVLGLVEQLSALDISLEYLDLGGGFGIGYEDESAMPIEVVARGIVPRVRGQGLRLVLEPGRYIVGEAGVLLTRVLYVKRSGPKTFVVTDGGMTELIRPSHYGGHHAIEPVVLSPDTETEIVDVVGPICESGDFLARNRQLPVCEPGDLLAVRTAGAYGFAMASNYNSRPRAAEVFVDGARAYLVRERESLEDLTRGEVIPAW